MKTTIQIKSAQGSLVSITVEHDEPMSLSTDLSPVPNLNPIPVNYPTEVDLSKIVPVSGKKKEDLIQAAKKHGWNVIGDESAYKKDRISRSPIKCANPNCQQSFVRKSNRQKYCSRKCRKNHEYLIQSAPVTKKDDVLDRPITKRCLKCNLNFTTYNPRELQCETCRPPKTESK